MRGLERVKFLSPDFLPILLPHRRFLEHIIRPPARHQHKSFEPLIDAAEKRARKRIATVPDISKPLRIDIIAREQQISASPQIDVLLNVDRHLLFVQRRIILDEPGMHNHIVGQKRNHARVRQHHRFVEKFFAIFFLRARHAPVAINHRRKRPFARRYDEICGHIAAVRSDERCAIANRRFVADVVNLDAIALLHAGLRHFERLIFVVRPMTCKVIVRVTRPAEETAEKSASHRYFFIESPFYSTHLRGVILLPLLRFLIGVIRSGEGLLIFGQSRRYQFFDARE